MDRRSRDIARQVVYGSLDSALSDDDRKLLLSVEPDRIIAALKTSFHRETRYAVGRRRAFQAALAIPSLDTVGFLIDIFNRAPVDWKIAICNEFASFMIRVRFGCSVLRFSQPAIQIYATLLLTHLHSMVMRQQPTYSHTLYSTIGEGLRGFSSS